ncbi:MAG: TIGR04190 family B12-binding domain/radical SAM domain protein [Caldilineaceae bacterium]|nr:TIGR04190 family B12-binding domain/radical SAM domain protein [Caldilineaceae bacterium]
MAQIDLLLLHPPSVYDFRERAILYGPISDLIPSSPVFEMYPLGFLTMTSYLEERGLNVRIVNLAQRMIKDRKFDVPAFLAKLNPKAVGIDLHWLPHAHGAIEVAKLVKQIHPTTPVIFGGLSSTYFHEELIRYPAVDYVLRGSSTELPLYELLMSLAAGQSPAQVPNLTWKADGEVRVNPLTFIPETLDFVDLMPERLVKMVLRHRDLQSVLPFSGWWQNPITAVFTVKGCAHECVTCGSSSQACELLSKRKQPQFRSPQSLVKNMLDISRFSKGPIFLVGDLRQAGDKHAYEILALLREAGIQNEIVFELFNMPPLEFLTAIDESVENWSLELSPESHDEEIRRRQDGTTSFTNAEMETVIQAAQSLGCHRIDVFFMIGLPQQTQKSVEETIHYCEHLMQGSDKRLSCFISPMGPFIDPASRGFEEPERFGYRLFAHTLEEHRQLLVQPSWQQILNYETIWMSRAELVSATYDAAEALNDLKLKYDRISRPRGEEVAHRIKQARDIRDRLDAFDRGEKMDPAAFQALQGEINAFSVSTVCDKKELFWRRHPVNYRPIGIMRIMLAYLRDLVGRDS